MQESPDSANTHRHRRPVDDYHEREVFAVQDLLVAARSTRLGMGDWHGSCITSNDNVHKSGGQKSIIDYWPRVCHSFSC